MLSIVVNRSSKGRGLSCKSIKKIVDFVCRQENHILCGKLSIAFITRDEVKALKKEFFHQDTDTDVISFYYGTTEIDGVWGEIIICPEKAGEQARDYGTSIEAELKLLLIHGFLHLLGYDDTEPEKKKKMEARQIQLLDQFQLDDKRKYLIEAAQNGQFHAYAPYSLFPVGAAIESCEGKVVQGGNIENASYGLSICAERVALFKAISMGYAGFVRLAIISSHEEFCLPCGACRQVLFEFAPYIEIIAARTDGDYRVFALDSLYPYPFSTSRKRDNV